jgi:hypothetical protein
MSTDFVGFPKIARYSREVLVTEKIDGTNACIYIGPDGEFLVGSRTRWITPEIDNHGFARWAFEHRDELLALGPGRHFGEWWGSGIQRGYGLPNGDKRFSLFNVRRWVMPGAEPGVGQGVLPPCVGLVPVIWSGIMDHFIAETMMNALAVHGSYAAPGYTNPEGIVIFHIAGNVGFKKTFEKDQGKT